MSTTADPIAVPPVAPPLRPCYALGVLLDAEDFAAEQGYHRGRLGRALAYLFGTGTAAGLRVTWRAASQQLVVEPGLALDPLGRLLEIPRPVAVRLRGGARPDDSWFEHVRGAGSNDPARNARLALDLVEGCTPGPGRVLVADVFVRLVVCDHAKSPAFATGPYDALDAAAATRRRDGCELGLVIRTEAHTGTLPIPDDRRILATQPSDLAGALQWHRERILAAWRDGSDDWDDVTGALGAPRPTPLEEHLPRRGEPIADDPSEVGRDPTSVLLARVRIPVTASDPPGDLGQDPVIDNAVRRFVLASGVFTRPSSGGGA